LLERAYHASYWLGLIAECVGFVLERQFMGLRLLSLVRQAVLLYWRSGQRNSSEQIDHAEDEQER